MVFQLSTGDEHPTNATHGAEETVCESRTSDIYLELEHELDHQTCDLQTFTWNSVVSLLPYTVGYSHLVLIHEDLV